MNNNLALNIYSQDSLSRDGFIRHVIIANSYDVIMLPKNLPRISLFLFSTVHGVPTFMPDSRYSGEQIGEPMKSQPRYEPDMVLPKGTWPNPGMEFTVSCWEVY